LDDPGEQVVGSLHSQYHWPAVNTHQATCTAEPATGVTRSRYALNGRTGVPRLCGDDFDAWFETWVSPPAVVQSPPTITTPESVVVHVPSGSTEALDDHEVTEVVDYAAGVSALDLEDGPTEVLCRPASGVAFQLGTTEVRCEATDSAGATATAHFDVHVHYPFELDGAVGEQASRMRAGTTARLRFGLGGDRGPEPIVDGGVASVSVDCTTGAALGDPEAAQVSLRQRRANRPSPPIGNVGEESQSVRSGPAYELRWTTEEAWAGQCRDLAIRLVDGTLHTVTFEFRPSRGRTH
jgi:hypothetical protein